MWTKLDTILLQSIIWRTSEHALMPLPHNPLQAYEPLHSGALAQDCPLIPSFFELVLEFKGRFTLWTMKSSHVRGLFCVGRLHGTTSMVRVIKILVFMVHGPFTRCKPNVDHEE